MSTSPPCGRLVVIGLGLIGGSLASAARLRAMYASVWGIARNDASCARAMELGVVDRAYTRLSDIAAQLGAGDIIFIAVPTLSVRQVLQDIRHSVSPDVTVTDGASVKGSVLADVQAVFGEIPPQVVLGHPIAGSERSGVEAADPALYEQHRVILTPTPETGELHLQRVADMWRQAGAEVLQMGVTEHDEILAATSHLPHAIAYSLVDTLAHDSQNENIFRYAAGGFRDFTRIASSDATMWRDIMLANQQSVLKAMDLFVANLGRLRSAVEQGDGAELLGIFTRAKAARDHFTVMLEKRRYTSQQASLARCLTLVADSPLTGTLRLPGDQNITLRALIVGALAEGITEISGFLDTEDTLATLQALRDMNVVIGDPSAGVIQVHGVGLRGLQAPVGPLYLGSSRASLRLLTGLLVAQPFDSRLSGDDALSQCPMGMVIGPLRLMGALVQQGAQSAARLKITGGQALTGIQYTAPHANVQLKSAVLLAGLYCKGNTTFNEPLASRDHMERLLQKFGYPVQTFPFREKGRSIVIAPAGHLQAQTVAVPSDMSMAMNYIVAALLVPGSSILLTDVGINPARTGGIEILKMMGADVQLLNERHVCVEPVADIQVRSSSLRGIEVPYDLLARAVDELPVLLAAASCAVGDTLISGIDNLCPEAVTRANRMAAGLQTLGLKSCKAADGWRLTGGKPDGGEPECFGDPYLAVAFAIVGLRASGRVRATGCLKLHPVFPRFADFAHQVGLGVDYL